MDLLSGIQLLFTVHVLLKGTEGQRLNISVSHVRKCPGKNPNGGYVHMSGSAHLEEAEITDYKVRLDVYVGPVVHPSWKCQVYFDRPPCTPHPAVESPDKSYFCWCAASREGGKTYDFGVLVPVNTNFKGDYIRVSWWPRVNTWHPVTYTTPAFPGSGEPEASLTMNGKYIPLRGDNCPAILFIEDAVIRFCVDFLHNPVVTMYFGGMQKYRFQQPCGQRFVPFDERRPTSQFVFGYADSCQRKKEYKCTVVQRMGLQIQPPILCKSKYVAGRDVLHVNGSLHLMDASPAGYSEKLDVYIGTNQKPPAVHYCVLSIDAGYCVVKDLDTGCWCDRVRGGGSVYDVHIKVPVTMAVNGKMLRVTWKSKTNSYPDEVFKSPIIKVVEAPKASVNINGREFTITRDTCPLFPVDAILNMTFCVNNLQSPRLRMWFDHHQSYSFTSHCGNVRVKLDSSFLKKPLWFSYSDSCKRKENIMCPQETTFRFGCVAVSAIRSESCRTRAMDNLMANVAVGYLLWANM